ncbi:hypothetical protein Tco_0210371 [Tanacetum coccineum]
MNTDSYSKSRRLFTRTQEEINFVKPKLLNLRVDEPAKLGEKSRSDSRYLKSPQASPYAWKLSDIQGINPEFCTHKILMEEDYKPAVQHQRRVNPKNPDVIKNDVEKTYLMQD